MDCGQREPSNCRQAFDNLTSTLDVSSFRQREPECTFLGKPFHLNHMSIECVLLGHKQPQLLVQTTIRIVAGVILLVVYYWHLLHNTGSNTL